MQVNTYISAKDYELLAKNKPAEFETVPQFMAEILRNKAEFYRKAVSSEGTPVVPQYERQ